jgi:hypothetical protein
MKLDYAASYFITYRVTGTSVGMWVGGGVWRRVESM